MKGDTDFEISPNTFTIYSDTDLIVLTVVRPRTIKYVPKFINKLLDRFFPLTKTHVKENGQWNPPLD